MTISTLESRMIGRRQAIYTPSNGFEDLLGNQPIKIIESNEIAVGNSLHIESLRILRLEDKISLENQDGIIRKIALLKDKSGHQAAIFFYQDDYNPKREKQSPKGEGYLSYNTFKDISTIGRVKIISTQNPENAGKDVFFEADDQAVRDANNLKSAGLKDLDEIRLSGSGIVIATDLPVEDFLKTARLHLAIGELFKENGVFKNNLILPGIMTKALIKNMKIVGAQTINEPDGFPDLIDFLTGILKSFNLKVTNEILYRALPFLVYIPYHAHYLSEKSTDILMKYAHLPTFEKTRISYIKDQFVLMRESILARINSK